MVHLQMNLNITFQFEWIKVHQQGHGDSSEQFPIELNTQVDSLATDTYKSNMIIPQCGAFYSGQVCYHQDGYHVQHIANAISSRESDEHILDYYTSNGWTEDAFLHVDWTAMEKFIRTQSPIVQCNTIKIMHN
jgi:hypothetical protein